MAVAVAVALTAIQLPVTVLLPPLPSVHQGRPDAPGLAGAKAAAGAVVNPKGEGVDFLATVGLPTVFELPACKSFALLNRLHMDGG